MDSTAPTDGAPGGAPRVGLRTVLVEWGRIGVLGFGGPPTHIALLRTLCVERRAWLRPEEFEDGIAATSLLPGPASTQLAIWCAWRLAGVPGALVGGLAFICPGLVLIVALAAGFVRTHPPDWVLGAAAGAGAAVPAVALSAARQLLAPSWRRASTVPTRTRWALYVAAGVATAALAGSYVVVVLLGAGLVECAVRTRPGRLHALVVLGTKAAVVGGIGALVWEACKVGALSFGGGFVIVPLMQHDAVTVEHWMTPTQFLGAVALGQVTPGPVVQTVAVVGYAAAGIGGAALAAAVAFAPSFAFVLGLGPRFEAIRRSAVAQGFLAGAAPCAIGAIGGAAITLGSALFAWWQVAVLAAALCVLLVLRRSIVACLLGAGVVGVVAAALGAQVAR